jgi:hypothetical protein
MTLNIEQTVRELAISNPAAVRVFESLGIDYCCGGKRPLQEACARAKVPVARVLELLAEMKPEPVSREDKQWADASFLDLTEHIVALHHSYIRPYSSGSATAGNAAGKSGEQARRRSSRAQTPILLPGSPHSLQAQSWIPLG